MKLGVIIPTRGDRPSFLNNCLRMLNAQDRNSSIDIDIHIVAFPPKDKDVDITPRYKSGYDYFRGKGYDLLALIEDDDFYAPNYLQVMLAQWDKLGKPDLFGTAKTMYYHIELRAYYIMEHHNRSSAMNTFIKPDMDFEWPVDLEPYLDLHLWKTIPNRMIWMPDKWYSVGCKHAIGKTIDGGGHRIHDDEYVKLRYIHKDTNEQYPNGFMKTVFDKDSYDFFWNYFS